MNDILRLKNLQVPEDRIDVILDTDAYNEIDDQFAVAYMFKNKEKLNIQALYAAPFHNHNSEGPGDGMIKSYDEILKLLDLLDEKCPVFKGSDSYLADEKTPVISDAAKDLAERVKKYSPENPLYVVAIGAITNIASAILLNPQVAENTVIVWLGGHGLHYHDTAEFNMYQDIAAARIVMGCGAPFVQLPCFGVVSSFTVSKAELLYWLKGKNKLADYLAENSIREAEKHASPDAPWTRCIWDVTAVAWLVNDNDRFMNSRIITSRIPTYDNLYSTKSDGQLMRYVYHIKRDELMADLFRKICD